MTFLFTQKKYWNTFYFLEHFKTIGIGLSLLVWILPIILFNKKRNTLIFVYLTFIGFILFEIITRRYGVRYNGLLFLTLIVGLWISSMQKELLLIKKDISRYNHYIILIVMFCQCIGGTVAYALDLKKPFNYGKTVSEYIQDIVSYALTFITIIAVVYIIYAGFRLMVSTGDDAEKVKKTKDIILYIIV